MTKTMIHLLLFVSSYSQIASAVCYDSFEEPHLPTPSILRQLQSDISTHGKFTEDIEHYLQEQVIVSESNQIFFRPGRASDAIDLSRKALFMMTKLNKLALEANDSGDKALLQKISETSQSLKSRHNDIIAKLILLSPSERYRVLYRHTDETTLDVIAQDSAKITDLKLAIESLGT